MTRPFAIALCAASAAVGAQAQTPETRPVPPLFETWKRACGDTRASYARSIVDPDVQSWKRITFPLPLPIRGVKLSDKTIRVKSFEKGVVRMFMAGTGQATFGGRPAKFEFCGMTAKPDDVQATVRRVQAWVGQQPASTEKGMTTFRFHEAPGGKRTPLGPGKLSDVVKGLGPGEAVSIDVGLQQRSTLINYTSIKL